MKTLRVLADIVLASRHRAAARAATEASRPARDEPLHTKLHHYLFIGWMLREPHGDLFMRQSLRRANLAALHRWLPHYARVHGVLTLWWAIVVWALGKTVGGVWLLLASIALVAEAMIALTLASALLAFVLVPH